MRLQNEDSLRASPTYSFVVFCILKHILLFREKEVYQHLEEYIRRASGLAGKREDLIEVCVLFVQCIEVSRYILLILNSPLPYKNDVIAKGKTNCNSTFLKTDITIFILFKSIDVR